MYTPTGYTANTLFNLMTGSSLNGEISIVFSDGLTSYTLTGDDVFSVSITSSLTDKQAYGIGNFASKQATLELLTSSLANVTSALGRYVGVPITITLQLASGVLVPMGVFYANPSDVISTEGISCTITAYDDAFYLSGKYEPSITSWPVTPTALINDIVTQHGDITLASDAYTGLNSTLISTAFCVDPTISSEYYTDSVETQTDTFTGNGSTTTFTLSHEPSEITSCTVGGAATEAYTTSGTSLVFDTAPANGAAISITYDYIFGGNLTHDHNTLNYRQAIAHVAYLMGCNAIFDRSGKLKFIPFVPGSTSRTSRMSITPAHYAALAFARDSNTKTYLGVLDAQYSYRDQNGDEQTITNTYTSSSAYSNKLTITSFDIKTSTVANKYGAAVLGANGIDYQGYSLSLLYGFPYLDCGDAFTLTDYDNNTYAGLPIFSVTHTYNGSFSTSMVAKALTDESTEATYSKDFIATLNSIGANASQANANAIAAQTSADTAASAAASAVESAQTASTAANAAATSAQEASDAASSAQSSANTALDQLGIVENVVGVLDLLTKHGTYEATQDTEAVPDKWYFTRSGTSPNYEYSVVQDPSGNPNTQGWYELTGIDEAIQNYVSSQLVVDNFGLWLRTQGIQSKVLLSSTDGVVLYGADGSIVGKYGTTAQVGDEYGCHISLNGTHLGFWRGEESNPANEIAYIDGQKLYITQSVVLQQMDLGEMVVEGGLGQWSWKVHPNGENPSRNNLNLKWIG